MRPTLPGRSGGSPSTLDYRMDLPNLPYPPLRELFQMLPMGSKRALRLVSHSFRDMIDVIYGIKFFVTLSDDTLACVFKFNRFDLAFSPRNLYCLNVTKLLSHFTLPSTSLSRCPLPRPIHTLTFTQNVSERNFIELLNFYGKTNCLRKLVVNLDCLETKITSTKALKKVDMNSIQELELHSTKSISLNMIDMVAALLNENYSSLRAFKTNIENGTARVPPVLYQNINVFISRHLKHLMNLEFIQPEIYDDGKLQVPLMPLFPVGPLRMNVLNAFEQESKLRELRLTVPYQEWPSHLNIRMSGVDIVDNLGMTLVNYQKYLVVLELTNFALTTTSGTLDLPKLLQNCGNTLTIVRLHAFLFPYPEWRGGVGGRNYLFNLGWLQPCKVLKAFEFTIKNPEYYYHDNFVRFLNTDTLPVSLESLVLSNQVQHTDIETIRETLPKLTSFGFGHQNVTLEQIQMLLGNEGMPSMRKVTLENRFCEDFEAISNWVRGRRENYAPTKRVTISEAHRVRVKVSGVWLWVFREVTLEKVE